MDMKPENILFATKKDQTIKLIDFHYARGIEENQELKILRGDKLPSI